jgi:hypothetical protein
MVISNYFFNSAHSSIQHYSGKNIIWKKSMLIFDFFNGPFLILGYALLIFIYGFDVSKIVTMHKKLISQNYHPD